MDPPALNTEVGGEGGGGGGGNVIFIIWHISEVHLQQTSVGFQPSGYPDLDPEHLIHTEADRAPDSGCGETGCAVSAPGGPMSEQNTPFLPSCHF